MLIYLASYPRAGSTWMRLMVHHYLARQACSWYPERDGSPDLGPATRRGPVFTDYSTEHEPHVKRRRLVNGCGPLFTEEFRRDVASLDEPFFVKTHERPFDRFFRGERVVLMARHPGATLWSYWHYLDDFKRASPRPTLDAVIRGHVGQGDWSAWHEDWLRWARMGDAFLVQRYEDLLPRHGAFVQKLARISRLAVRAPLDSLPPFEHWQQVDPRFFRVGGSDAWRGHVSRSQWSRLMGQHGAVMTKLGYAVEPPPESGTGEPTDVSATATDWVGKWRALRNLWRTL